MTSTQISQRKFYAMLGYQAFWLAPNFFNQLKCLKIYAVKSL